MQGEGLSLQEDVFYVMPIELSEGGDSRYLVTMPPGIGDTVAVGLSAIDQIIRNDRDAAGKIDVLCNRKQAEVFACDPRIHRLIIVRSTLFPSGEGTFLRGIFPGQQVQPLVRFLRSQRYEAVVPGMPAPTFFYLLGLPVMFASLPDLGKDILALHEARDRHISYLTRKVVNAFFKDALPPPELEEAIPLYLTAKHVRAARLLMDVYRGRSDDRVLLVAPDTSSIITRPPTPLLLAGIGEALARDERLRVVILPAYTLPEAADQLYKGLKRDAAGRVFRIMEDQLPDLLTTTALIDQADLFLCGDTGLMHLAIALKLLSEPAEEQPRNQTRVIVLFGGTNPCFFGYSTRSVILGRNRKEQRMLVPGIAKELYDRRERDFFDHIEPAAITAALLAK
uniref:ADP-heptose--LPS heptosyltransferase n=1 Tax=Thermosporothrix sp. COM3 TaxID=2490863 RepID=A0A455SLZ1_9CHLR|nr:hypothetical protein KTC_08450 [Thermosporothrix sp. COM3]